MPDPILQMPAAQALSTIAAYLRAIPGPASQLPQAQSDAEAAAANPPAPGVLVSPLQQALLPLEATYAAIFPQGSTEIPADYATRLEQIAQSLTAPIQGPLHDPGAHLPSPSGGGIVFPTPSGGGAGAQAPDAGGGDTTKKAMSPWVAVTGVAIVAAGAGALWWVYGHRRGAGHATHEAMNEPAPKKRRARQLARGASP